MRLIKNKCINQWNRMGSPEINPLICDCLSGKFIGNEVCVSEWVCGVFVCVCCFLCVLLNILLWFIRNNIHVHDEKKLYYTHLSYLGGIFMLEYLLMTACWDSWVSFTWLFFSENDCPVEIRVIPSLMKWAVYLKISLFAGVIRWKAIFLVI